MTEPVTCHQAVETWKEAYKRLRWLIRQYGPRYIGATNVEDHFKNEPIEVCEIKPWPRLMLWSRKRRCLRNLIRTYSAHFGRPNYIVIRKTMTLKDETKEEIPTLKLIVVTAKETF